jgi:hypothetical protein
MKRKIISFVIVCMMILALCPTAFAGTVTISDNKLSEVLYALTGTPQGTPLTTEKLQALTGDINLSGRGIQKIDGIQHLTGATSIDLSLNSITSVPREIEQLDSLQKLDLSGNRITRLPSNIGGMTALKELDIRANRLDVLTSGLKNLSLDSFNCDYNFLDISDGSETLGIINLISAGTKEYKNQLVPLQNFSAYSPTSGTIVLYWDKLGDLSFNNGTVGHVKRICVLDSGYNYVGETSSSNTTYTIDGLDPSTEYTYHISADYYIKGTKYDGTYIKLYRDITALPVPQNTPVPGNTPTPTPMPTEEPTPEPMITAIPTATPVQAVATPIPTATPAPTPIPKKGGGTFNALYIIIVILLIVFIFITLYIVARILQEKRNNRNNNNRYRR